MSDLNTGNWFNGCRALRAACGAQTLCLMASLLMLFGATAFSQTAPAPSPESAQPGASATGSNSTQAPAVHPTTTASPSRENPAQVVYQQKQGSLAIITDHSSLAKVLAEINTKLGIPFEGNVGNDQVSGKFGPGVARDVIESLLRKAGYNYILVGDGTRDSLTSVVIAGKNQELDEAANGSQAGTGTAPSGGAGDGTAADSGAAAAASGDAGDGTPTPPAAADTALQNPAPVTAVAPSPDGSPYMGGNPNASTVQQSHAQLRSLMQQQSQQLGGAAPSSPPPQ